MAKYGLVSESTNRDVYRYGILMLEMVTTRKPIDVFVWGRLESLQICKNSLAWLCDGHCGSNTSK